MNLSFWAGVAVTIIAIVGYREYQEIKNMETVEYGYPCFDSEGNTNTLEALEREIKKELEETGDE
ncbi:MAG: hypothetical protein IJN72_08030 [Firmicutes bacterium]|nr:hypothetical protein [Bacillota bacterium]